MNTERANSLSADFTAIYFSIQIKVRFLFSKRFQGCIVEKEQTKIETVTQLITNELGNRMRFYHQRQFDRFKRAIGFVEDHAGDFSSGARALSLKDQLKEVVEKLGTTPAKTKAVAKSSASPSGKQAALNALREELGQVARTATAIESFNPDFKNTFVLPDKRRKDDLAQAATRFIKDATKSKQAFLDFEMKDDFIDVLQSKLDQYKSAQSAPAASTPASNSSLSQTTEDIQSGLKLMQTLEIMMENKYRDDDAALTEWTSAVSIETVPRKKKKDKTEK